MPEIRFNPILNARVTQPVQTAGSVNASRETARTSKPSESFSEVFDNVLTGADSVKFSKHAQTRLESRNIALDAGDLKKLGGAVDAANEKGVQESLIVMDGLAFIVSVPDRTVVTAMPMNEAASNVFTNIDGAVIA